MPGQYSIVDQRRIVGWACHDRYASYHVLLHVVLHTVIIRSLIVNGPGVGAGAPGTAGHWFDIDLAELELPAAHVADLRLLIGETDESVAPLRRREPDTPLISIEEILWAPFRRAWVVGGTYIDAQRKGMSTATIVDLFYRDFLHRPADQDGLANYTARIQHGELNYDGLRQELLQSDEYRARRHFSYEAPGAIFSHKLVAMAKELPATAPEDAAGLQVPVDELLALDDSDFVAAAYRRILGRDADAAGEFYYLAELAAGRRKLDILLAFAAEPEAVMRDVVLTEPLVGGAVADALLPWPEERDLAWGWSLLES
jgi:hypothetical protein